MQHIGTLDKYGTIYFNTNIGCQINTFDGEYLDFEFYSCKLIGKETTVKPPKYTVKKALNSFRRIIAETDNQEDELKVTFLFKGSHDFIWRSIRTFTEKTAQCYITFSTEEYTYECFTSGNEPKVEFKDWETAIVEFKFNAQCFTEKEEFDVLNGYGEYYIRGSKPTPINFTIKANQNVNSLVINEITVKSLNKGDILYINSFDKQVTINGENAIGKVTLFDFPDAVGKYIVNVSDKTCDCKIDYKARW